MVNVIVPWSKLLELSVSKIKIFKKAFNDFENIEIISFLSILKFLVQKLTFLINFIFYFYTFSWKFWTIFKATVPRGCTRDQISERVIAALQSNINNKSKQNLYLLLNYLIIWLFPTAKCQFLKHFPLYIQNRWTCLPNNSLRQKK